MQMVDVKLPTNDGRELTFLDSRSPELLIAFCMLLDLLRFELQQAATTTHHRQTGLAKVTGAHAVW